MGYSVKEIFYTLQGEGARTGRPSVFCRFAGCNLWTGREQHRGNAICQFCDTDFVGTNGPGGGRFKTAEQLATTVSDTWAGDDNTRRAQKYVVCTGGEPLLQLDAQLVEAFHARGFEVAVETNGTRAPVEGLDWICMSPKAGAPLSLVRGNELKLVFPQKGAPPADFEGLEFDQFFLQPMDGPEVVENTQAAIEYCLAHPRWRLSLQTHKLLGIP
jgi:7-carboxy-7-deazaguanine synthase (Cx14CxxC type)